MFFLKEGPSGQGQPWPELAASVTEDTYGSKLTLKSDIGTGHFKTVEFGDGLKIVLMDYTINRGFSKVYDNSSDEYYCLHINQVKATGQFSVFINDYELHFSNKLYSSVFLACSGEPFEIRTTPGTYFNQLKIVIPKSWPAQHLPHVFDPLLLERYFDLREERLYFDSLDTVYLKLVNRLVDEVENIRYLPLVHGMVTIIIDRFLYRMNAKIVSSEL